MDRNIYTEAGKNVWRTWGFMLLFMALVSAIGWFISYYYNSSTILFVAIILALLTNFYAYWFSDKLVLSLHRAKEATRAEYFDLWNTVENLSITAGLPMPKVYIVDDPSPNAFATGRNKEHAVVCVTTGLLKILDKTELEGVIAHELSHIGNRDMLLGTVAVVLAGFVGLLANFFFRARFFGQGRNRDENNGSGILIIFGFLLLILAPLFATLLRLAISRKREFLADADGALLTRYPEGLANALRKISASSIPLRTANSADAHLFFSNPLKNGGGPGTIAKLFMTHPPVEDRIQALTGESYN